MSDPQPDTTNTSAKRATALITALQKCQEDVQNLLASLTTADLALPTVCEGWNVGAESAHILDATTMLVEALEQAAQDEVLPPPTFRPEAMASEMSASALRLATTLLSPADYLASFNQASSRLLQLLAERDASSWDAPVAHPYLGHCPAVQIAGFALLDWFIHPWDIRQALGQPNEPNPDHAALLVPGLIALLPRRLNPAQAGNLQGRFRYIIESLSNNTDNTNFDVVLSNQTVTIERSPDLTRATDLTFKGPAPVLVLAMLGRRSAVGILQPAPTNQTWLPRWSSLWISL
jgi:uncharacterized protein (TIGR03083 family)